GHRSGRVAFDSAFEALDADHGPDIVGSASASAFQKGRAHAGPRDEPGAGRKSRRGDRRVAAGGGGGAPPPAGRRAPRGGGGGAWGSPWRRCGSWNTPPRFCRTTP